MARIIIFGASGGTGRNLVKQALRKNHKVTAFVRNPKKLGIKHKNLSIFQGDALNKEDVEKAVKGHKIVLSALGWNGRTPLNTCSRGAENIIKAMKKHNARRLVVESAFGAGKSDTGLYSLVLNLIIRPLIKDKRKMESLIKKSGLEWIIARPTKLTNSKKTKKYRTGEKIPVSVIPKISRADTAHFMLSEATARKPGFLCKSPTITY